MTTKIQKMYLKAYAEAYRLRCEGLTYREIAEKLGLPDYRYGFKYSEKGRKNADKNKES